MLQSATCALKQIILFRSEVFVNCVYIPFLLCQFILITFTFPLAAEFLEKHQDRFISDMDAKKMAEALQRKGVIPEEIATEIANALSTEKANGVLYNHLHSQASADGLKLLFELCSEKKGYRKMNDFGKEMLGELEQGGKLALALTLLKGTIALYNCPWLLLLLVLQVVLLQAGDEVTVTLPCFSVYCKFQVLPD